MKFKLCLIVFCGLVLATIQSILVRLYTVAESKLALEQFANPSIVVDQILRNPYEWWFYVWTYYFSWIIYVMWNFYKDLKQKESK